MRNRCQSTLSWLLMICQVVFTYLTVVSYSLLCEKLLQRITQTIWESWGRNRPEMLMLACLRSFSAILPQANIPADLVRPAGSPWIVVRSGKLRRWRRNRKQKQGCRGGLHARLKKQPLKPLLLMSLVTGLPSWLNHHFLAFVMSTCLFQFLWLCHCLCSLHCMCLCNSAIVPPSPSCFLLLISTLASLVNLPGLSVYICSLCFAHVFLCLIFVHVFWYLHFWIRVSLDFTHISSLRQTPSQRVS